MAEKETDEVYAQITLLPEIDQCKPESPDPKPDECPMHMVHSFCKILTASDTSTQGGFSVLRKHATDCLPSLDMSQPIPTQDLVARDLHGYEWRGQPRRHLLTTGWSTFVTSNRLVAGDAFVFFRSNNGELRVGVRRHARQQAPMPTSVISSHNMHLGVLVTASHAFRTQTHFVVYYKPRMCFKMQFEGEESSERRFTGTIVGVRDISPEWSDTKWRSLKVQWDEPSTIPRPDRVSSWEIEHFVPSASLSFGQPVTKSKRVRPIEIPSSELNSGSHASSIWYHGHESFPTNDGPQPRNISDVHPRQIDNGNWPSSPRIDVSLNLFTESTGEKAYRPSRSILSEFVSPTCPNDSVSINIQSDKGHKSDTSPCCWLFGFDLLKKSYHSLNIEKIMPCKTMATVGTNEIDSDVFQADISPKEVISQTGKNLASRLRTKVQMQGMAVGRAVDLATFKGYDHLIEEQLENIFEIKGLLHSQEKLAVVFTDDENNMMLVGDDPWPAFCKMVKKICIFSREEVKKMGSKLELPPSPPPLETTVLSLDSEERQEI